MVCNLTILILTPSFGWFSLCSKLTSYNNYLWHHNLINYFCEIIVGIWSIPFISLSFTDDDVNSLDILASNFIAFIYTFCYLKSSLQENGYALVILRELCTFVMFYTNCASLRSSSYNLFSNHCGFVLLSLVGLHNLFLTSIIPHI